MTGHEPTRGQPARRRSRAEKRLVVIGASAGGVQALKTLASELPIDFPVPILVVLHLAPDFPSLLPEILNKAGPLAVVRPTDGEPMLGGHIYVASPDRHLIVEDGHIGVTRGPKENRSRPSIDTLFRSAAYSYGPGVVGVVLSGMLDDGTSGLWTVKRRGGVAVVQSPEDAEYDSMPRNALEQVAVDHVVPVRELSRLLQVLVARPQEKQPAGRLPRDRRGGGEARDMGRGSPAAQGEGARGEGAQGEGMDELQQERLKVEVGVSKEEGGFQRGVMELGELSTFACPECHGVMVQIQEGGLLRFRCHTGHAFTASALLSDLSKSVEQNVYSLLRVLEEEVMLLRQLEAMQQNDEGLGRVYRDKADQIEAQLAPVRELALHSERLSEDSLRRRSAGKA